MSVESLRDHAQALLKSRLVSDFQQLPAVRAWLESEKFQHLASARGQIEKVLGVDLTLVRDELLGDAVVLALRLPPEGPADAQEARGLILTHARDVALLKRLIDVFNATQRESGELAGIAERHWNGTTYYLREFPAALSRPSEAYIAYSDGTFALSNSEAMIQSVIDRKASLHDAKVGQKTSPRLDPGLGDVPGVKALEGKLPDRALVRLLVNPRPFERLLGLASRPTKPGDARVAAVLARYLAAVEFAGAALTWNDQSIVIQSVETLNPSLLDPWLRRWATDTRRGDPTLASVPPTALAVGTGHLHALAALDALSQIVPEEQQIRFANLETMLTGLLLGQDLRARILPFVGPGVVAYVDSPEEPNEQAVPVTSHGPAVNGWPLPVVMAVSLGGSSEQLASLAAVPILATALSAIDNALRTVLAMAAMDEKRSQGPSRIITRVVAGTTVTTLDPSIAFAYAVDRVRTRVVLSNSPAAVARYLEHASEVKSVTLFDRLHAEAFADATTFACIDFDALRQLASKHKNTLVQTLAARQNRPAEDVDRDLSHVLALARLFRAGFITSRFEPDASAVHRSVGLIGHEQGEK